MRDTSENIPASKGSRAGIFITIVIIIAVITLFVVNSPRGYDTDLKKVGDGQPSLVLVFDPNAVSSGDAMRVLDAIRPQFETKMHFLVADIGRSEAHVFLQQHQVKTPTVLLFSEQGKQVKDLPGAITADELRDEILGAFGW